MKTYREIKFRAWDKQTKKMSPAFVLFGEMLLMGAIHSWQRYEGNNSSGSLEALDDLEVMQFTGLKDQKGKEIYEGDIMAWRGNHIIDNNNLAMVHFNNGSFMINGINGYGANWWLGEYNEAYEIIGNVFETPELITK